MRVALTISLKKIAPDDPHVRLLSLVHYAAYPATSELTSTTAPGPLMEIGYVHVVPEVRVLYHVAFPDIVLKNEMKKKIILIEAKSEAPPDLLQKVSKKFSSFTFEIVREHFGSEYHVECALLTYESRLPHFLKNLDALSQKIGRPLLLWYVSDEPAPYGDEEAYFIKKWQDPKHQDASLEEKLSHGVPIPVDRYVPKPLLDINPKRKYIFSELAVNLLLKSIERGILREERVIRTRDFLQKFKRDYPSPVSIERLLEVLSDITRVFPELAELSRTKETIRIKTARGLDLSAFSEIIAEILQLEDKEYREYIRKKSKLKT